MSTAVNSAGVKHAHALVAAGKVSTDTWDFTAADGNALLGPDGNDWTSYGEAFLATHPDQTPKTKGYYGYPVSKGGKIYKNAVASAKGRAAQQGATGVEAACSSLLDEMAKGKSAPILSRAYSRLDIKAVQEDENNYTITGIASTPTPDRMGDVVEPMGAKYKLPMPLLWQHRADQPVGIVNFAKPSKSGIPFTATLPKVKEAGNLKDRVDEAVQSIKYKLVAAVSIGFQSVKDAVENLKDGGYLFKEWEWLELSLVTIPANADATISTIKSIDSKQLAASGTAARARPDPNPPGVTGTKNEPAKRRFFFAPKEGKHMNTQERIASLEQTRTAKVAELNDLMTEASTGDTMDATQTETYETLSDEIKSLAAEIKRFRDAEELFKAQAVPVRIAEVNDDAEDIRRDADKSRAGQHSVIAVRKREEKGLGFARLCGIVAGAKGNLELAAKRAHEIFPNEKPLHDAIKVMGMYDSQALVEKSAIASGTSTDSVWAGPLVNFNVLAQEFFEFLRPQTVIGRINGFRRVPFNVKVPRQTGGTTAYWTAEGNAKPVSKGAFDLVTLTYTKLAGISVITQELARFSSPNAEVTIRNDLGKAIAEQLDMDFLDPANAGTAGAKPASITNGLSNDSIIASAGGVTQANVSSDLKKLKKRLTLNNIDTTGAYLVMAPDAADGLALVVNGLGQYIFPQADQPGGKVLGLEVITSNVMSKLAGTDTSQDVILFQPNTILFADDGQSTIDASDQASVQMDSSPDNPSTAATVMVSLWQRNLLGIRAERYVNWVRGRNEGVAYLTGVQWQD